MTDERRQDIIILALMASLAAHVGLMFLMKPQVMTKVTAGLDSVVRQRNPMTAQDYKPQAETVAMDVVKDTEATRAEPEAVAEELTPTFASVGAPDMEALKAVLPDLPVQEVVPVENPVIEVAPFMSEKIHVENIYASYTTPIADNPMKMSSAVVGSSPESEDELVADESVDVQMFTAPAFVPNMDAPISKETPALESELVKERKEAEFVPVAEVLPSVDEKVVEREKEAVRELLDMRGAKEMSGCVKVTATSASEGEWLYFRVKMIPELNLETVPKDVVVLMDASGSIGNDRLESCRAAAQKILRSVTNTGDRFNLVAFRDRFSYAFKSWQECNQSSFKAADKWLNSLVAHGRTDVFATIRSVLTLPRDPKRPLIAMVVTDGDANSGVSETSRILSKFTALNDGLISVYMYGVKATANRELLDVLTHGNRGESFIYGGERWNAGSGIETLSERFRDPVLTDLRVVFTSKSKAEIFPRLLRNLYRGESVDLVGRVPKGSRKVSFSVRGLNGATPYESFFEVDLSNVEFDKSLPNAWRRENAIDAKLY